MGNKLAYQREGKYFAQCGRELERLVADELGELGATTLETGRGGVYFRAAKEALYRINYCSRLSSRILAPLISFPCLSENDLYQYSYDFEWESILDTSQTFAIFAHVSQSRLSHSQFAALKLKDAIADRFRKKTGRRPSVDRSHPDLWLNLNIHSDLAVLSLDTSGGPLHRRGYRLHGGEAPLQETLAAAIIRLSGWDEKQKLYDPLCGSGTLLAEALLHWCRIPAGFKRRRFGFENLPDYDRSLWEKVKITCDRRIRDIPQGLAAGSDIDGKIIKAARANLKLIPSGQKVLLAQADFRRLPGLENNLIVCNLPYGVRSGEREALKALYKDFGDFLKKKCPGATVFALCGNLDLIGSIGLKPARRIPLYNGPIECRLLRFEIY